MDTIGNTPMVRINRLNPNPKVNIYAKLEGFNPTGSIKDRIAVAMVESEEAIEMARRIIREEGIFAGMSSGAALLAAGRTSEKIKKGNIVVVFPDRAEKYLSTTMFAPFED